MTIYVNDKNEIKDVDTTTDSTLKPIEVKDGQFGNWSIARICCYKVNVADGYITMMTPYVDSRLIDHIDQLGKQTEKNFKNIDEAEAQALYTALMTDTLLEGDIDV